MANKLKKAFTDNMQDLINSRKTKSIKLTNINLNKSTQARIKINSEIVSEYAELIKNGTHFPPIIVFEDITGKKHIADGWHRFKATKSAKIPEIECEIKQGSLRDAILFSLSANSTNGLRRTNEDKRKAVLTLLNDDEWKNYSTRQIGELAGVSNATVSRIKNETGTSTSETIGLDGRIYKNQTTVTKQHSNKRGSYKKQYKVNLEVKYKDEMKIIINSSGLSEEALFKEAIHYLNKKYIINKN